MDAEDVKKAVGEILDEKLSALYIDREKHFHHHEFVESIIKLSDRVSSTFIKTIVSTVVISLFSLLVLGLILWGKKNF